MKKMKLFYVLMASTMVLGACSKRNNSAPVSSSTVVIVTISPRDTTALYGDSINFTMIATSTASLTKAVFTQSINGGAATQVGSPITLTNSHDKFTTKYYVPTGTPGTIKLTCTVTDNTGNTDTASSFITVLTDINTYIGVKLANYADQSGFGSFYSSSNDSVYDKKGAIAHQKLIDLIFYYSATNLYSLAGPADPSFGTGSGQISADSVQAWVATQRNTTIFTNISSITSLNGITSAKLLKDAFVNGIPYPNPGTLANNLAVGQIIGFQTENNKSGLIKIDQASGGDPNGDGALTIDVVVQK